MNLLPAGLFRRITPIIQMSALCLTLVAKVDPIVKTNFRLQ